MFKRIKKLEEVTESILRDLEDQKRALYELEHPPKFKMGDKITFIRRYGDKPTDAIILRCDADVTWVLSLCYDHQKYICTDWKYLIAIKNGDEIIGSATLNEYEIGTPQPKKK